MIWNGPIIPKTSRRHTVVSGRVDTSGLPNFLEAGTDLDITLRATDTPLVVTFSNGFNQSGPIDYISYINADVVDAWTNLAASSVHYLYIERALDGTITYGSTTTRPYYCSNYTPPVVDTAETCFLLHMNAVNNGETFIDSSANGLTVTNTGNLQAKTSIRRFGISSAYNLTAADKLSAADDDGWALTTQDWTIDFWVYHTALATASGYCGQYASTTSLFSLYINTSNQLCIQARNGSTTPICFMNSASGFVVNQWNHVEWSRSGADVYLFVNGVPKTLTKTNNITALTSFPNVAAIFTVLSSVTPTTANDCTGYMDEFRVTIGAVRHTEGFTPERRPYASSDESYTPTEHWYDIPNRKMMYYNGSSSAQIHRVFVGECETTASGITSVTPYALNGEYHKPRHLVSASTVYNYNHNIGCNMVQGQVLVAVAADGTMADIQQAGMDYRAISFNSGASAVEASVGVKRAF